MADEQLVYREERCIRCYSCVHGCPNQAIKILNAVPTVLKDACKHFGECINACPTKAREIAGKRTTVSEVMLEVQKDTVFYDESGGGVTFSGGEPFSQPDFLLNLLKACNSNGISTAVETCGFVALESLLKSAPYVGLYLYDLKATNNDAHEKFTGVSNEIILRNLRDLSQIHDRIIVRFPLIPGVNDSDVDVAELGEFVCSLRGVKEVDVLPYHEFGNEKYRRFGMANRMPDMKPPPAARVEEVVKKLQGYGLLVKVGG